MALSQSAEKDLSHKSSLQETAVSDSLDTARSNHVEDDGETPGEPHEYQEESHVPSTGYQSPREQKSEQVRTSGSLASRGKSKRPSTNFIERNVARVSQKESPRSYVVLGANKAAYDAKVKVKSEGRAEPREQETEMCSCDAAGNEKVVESDAKFDTEREDTRYDQDAAPKESIDQGNASDSESINEEEELLFPDVHRVQLDSMVNHRSTPPLLEKPRPFMEPIIRGPRVISYNGTASSGEEHSRIVDPYRPLARLRSARTHEHVFYRDYPLLTCRNSPEYQRVYELHARPHSYPILAADYTRYHVVSPSLYSYQLPLKISSTPSPFDKKMDHSLSGADNVSNDSLDYGSTEIPFDQSVTSFPERLSATTGRSANHQTYRGLVTKPVYALPRGLGRDTESAEYLVKKQRADRQRQYSEIIRQQQLGRTQRPLSEYVRRPTFEDKVRQSRRFAAQQYAQSISKPVRTRRDLYKQELSAHPAELVSPIAAMRIRHEEEKRAADRMRYRLTLGPHS